MKVDESGDTPARPAASAQVSARPSFRTASANERGSRISLKQWRLFHAVVDNDGFVGAANKLHVSQSAISHALAKVQDQLGVPLFTLVGRKAQLTDQGKVLLQRSRDLVRQAIQLEEFGETLRLGWEPEVRLVVEHHFPVDLLMRTSRDLGTAPHEIPLSVSEMGLYELRNSLHAEAVDFAISSVTVSGFSSQKLIDIEHVAVAHAESPLFRMNRMIRFGDLGTHPQIVLDAADHGMPEPSASAMVPGRRCWKVNSLDSAETALQYGLGYAWLPRYRIQRLLDAGAVRVLPLEGGASYTKPMHLIRGRNALAGSSVLRFADVLRKTANEYQSELANDRMAMRTAGFSMRDHEGEEQ